VETDTRNSNIDPIPIKEKYPVMIIFIHVLSRNLTSVNPILIHIKYNESRDILPYTGNILASSKDTTSPESSSASLDGYSY
jgi:hypothetical protein